MKGFFVALQFLTIIPVRIKEIDPKDFGRSLLFFPIIGGLIGLLLYLVSILFNFLPEPAMKALVLVSLIIITGAIHLDGFVDTCDGIFSLKSREESLDIMRKPEVGAMGAIGLFSLLILKYSLFLSIPKELFFEPLVLMTTFGRFTQVLACFLSDYARNSGNGKYFVAYATKYGLIGALSFTLAIFLFLMEIKGLILLISSILPIFLFILYLKRVFSGMTGDTVGAVNEISEIIFIFLFVFLWKIWS